MWSTFEHHKQLFVITKPILCSRMFVGYILWINSSRILYRAARKPTLPRLVCDGLKVPVGCVHHDALLSRHRQKGGKKEEKNCELDFIQIKSTAAR